MAHDCVIELMMADLNESTTSDEEFLEACKTFIGSVEKVHKEELDGCVEKYADAASRSGAELLGAMRSDQLNNYIVCSYAALKAAERGIAKRQYPLVAWAAANKHNYEGLKGEIANLRFLINCGYEVDAQDENGNTAMHYMSNMRWKNGPHARAMHLLLRNGASPNVKNKNGDSVLAYMAGNTPFKHHFETFLSCVANGGDVMSESNDGMTVLDILKERQQVHPEEERRKVIEMIEANL